MKQNILWAKKKIKAWITATEKYFLGVLENNTYFSDKIFYQGQPIFDRFLLLTDVLDGQAVILQAEEQTVVHLLALPKDEARGSFEGSLLVKPPSLESVVPIIETLTENLEKLVVILVHMSCLPSEKEFDMRYKKRSHFVHRRAFYTMFAQLKRLCVNKKIRLVIADHELMLGKEKCAFLRRLFLGTQGT